MHSGEICCGTDPKGERCSNYGQYIDGRKIYCSTCNDHKSICSLCTNRIDRNNSISCHAHYVSLKTYGEWLKDVIFQNFLDRAPIQILTSTLAAFIVDSRSSGESLNSVSHSITTDAQARTVCVLCGDKSAVGGRLTCSSCGDVAISEYHLQSFCVRMYEIYLFERSQNRRQSDRATNATLENNIANWSSGLERRDLANVVYSSRNSDEAREMTFAEKRTFPTALS